MTAARPTLAKTLDVLRAAGFRVLEQGSDFVTLRRGARWLQVPTDEDVLARRWDAVLTSAGMDQPMFDTLALAARSMLSELPSSRNLRVATAKGKSR